MESLSVDARMKGDRLYEHFRFVAMDMHCFYNERIIIFKFFFNQRSFNVTVMAKLLAEQKPFGIFLTLGKHF